MKKTKKVFICSLVSTLSLNMIPSSAPAGEGQIDGIEVTGGLMTSGGFLLMAANVSALALPLNHKEVAKLLLRVRELQETVIRLQSRPEAGQLAFDIAHIREEQKRLLNQLLFTADEQAAFFKSPAYTKALHAKIDQRIRTHEGQNLKRIHSRFLPGLAIFAGGVTIIFMSDSIRARWDALKGTFNFSDQEINDISQFILEQNKQSRLLE